MSSLLVYTCRFGSYDTVRPQAAQDVPVDWVCLTDDPRFTAPGPWETICVRREAEHPNLAAKLHKAVPPPVLGSSWEAAIWVDANVEVTSRAFAREAVGRVHDGLAVWKHPRRGCVYDEAEASLPSGAEGQGGRYRNLPIVEQMDAYRAEGYPPGAGLFATGTLVWTPPAVETVGTAWRDEIVRWGFHDQLALPVVCWRAGVTPGTFGFAQAERRHTPRSSPGVPHFLANRWLRFHPHARAPYL